MGIYEAKWNKSGNVKLGNSIWSFSKLAGSGILAGCQGTCVGHCDGCYNPEDPKKSTCYVFNSYLRFGWDHSSVVKGHVRNTKAINENPKEAFTNLGRELQRAQNKPTACRIHASGELQSAQELRNWFKLAKSNPTIPFYIYTKNFEVVDEVMFQLKRNKKEMLPDNFFLNISIWKESGIECYNRWKNCKNIRAFAYQPKGFDYSTVGLKIDCHCPAYNEQGQLDHRFNCDSCGICFQSKAKVCACYEH